MRHLHDDDGPTTPREGLEWLEFLAQDHYDLDPNLRTAVALLEAELVRVGELEKVAQALMDAAFVLSDERIPFAIIRVIMQAKKALEGGDTNDRPS